MTRIPIDPDTIRALAAVLGSNVDPVRVVNGRYLAPSAPGYSIEIKPESLSELREIVGASDLALKPGECAFLTHAQP